MQVLRRLEQELLAFKLDTETKLTEEARKLSGVIVDQRKIGESVDLAAADQQGSTRPWLAAAPPTRQQPPHRSLLSSEACPFAQGRPEHPRGEPVPLGC